MWITVTITTESKFLPIDMNVNQAFRVLTNRTVYRDKDIPNIPLVDTPRYLSSNATSALCQASLSTMDCQWSRQSVGDGSLRRILIMGESPENGLGVIDAWL
jgi:hypothetical protein